ncbi:Checkpoint serine/threonine-protein kinase [Penicillium rolfsii]|nr:Checkpoint serine/threonine-protein kinase [Penicillium rolfsii]
MAGSDDLIDFGIIEAQKENVQSLPGGRSARELARIFSGGSTSDKYAVPSPNDTRTINGAIRQEFENELESIGESDDPLDVYDRYVKWTLNAYPSAQATAESGLLPLLERATKSFLSSSYYRNDPRYLRLWMHYIRLFSDAPRETFAFLARHHIGEGLALFYEEFAAWLEGSGRWTQADEVYRLGMDREARPVERLARKYSEFQQRYELQSQDAGPGPSSPALPAVRPALAAKMDPFASTETAANPQSSRSAVPPAGPAKTKSGKMKMAIFSDADAGQSSQPATSGQTKGWDSIGSMRERRKENEVEAKPWVGETLKAGKKPAPTQKMAIFRDESNSNQPSEQPSAPRQIPEHHVREAVNPRTGRRERVFVDLEAVYPDHKNPAIEVSFEELRAMRRGWMDKDWRPPKGPLRQISGNAPVEAPPAKLKIFKDEPLSERPGQKLATDELPSQSQQQDGPCEGKAGKARKFKVQGETQTIKMKFDSPTSSKARRKSTREPTMTMHTRAATDEIYGIFNQPLKAEMDDAADSLYGSEYEDEDCASTVDSTGTGHISAASSDFGDDETHTFHKSYDDTEYGDGNTTRADSVAGGDWTDFSVSKDVPGAESAEVTSHSILSQGDLESQQSTPEKERFVPRMPDDYNPPFGTYRDPAIMAQNRLPFMTPIVERTESSISMTAARSLHNAKTPCKPRPPSGVPQMGDLLSSPFGTTTPYHGDHTVGSAVDVPFSPTAFKALAPKSRRREAIIKDLQCNPTDKGIRNTILNSLEPPLASYPGYHGHVQDSNYASMIQKFVRAHSRKSRSADDERSETPILEFPGAERSYIIRRELGAGAYAPVYLAESVDSQERSYASDSDEEIVKSNPYDSARSSFEAVKVENGPSSAWEFYMIRTTHERLCNTRKHTRAVDSVVRAHELHVHQRESFLVEDYRGQGTLLDLVNILRNDSISSSHPTDGGLDESLAMFFSIELFRTVEALHATGILHGDIKADNCLVRLDDSLPSDPPTKGLSLLDLGENSASTNDPRDTPAYAPSGAFGWRAKGLALIDFGRAIDMSAFSPNVQFLADWETGTHECNEIREARPWTHQIDLYGIAGVIHVLLFGKYIKSAPVRTSDAGASASTRTYRIRESLKRYWDREIWSDVFDLLLNPGGERWVSMEIDDAVGTGIGGEVGTGPVLPVLKSMAFVRGRMEDWLVGHAEKKGLALQLRRIEAVLAERKRKLERV